MNEHLNVYVHYKVIHGVVEWNEDDKLFYCDAKIKEDKIVATGKTIDEVVNSFQVAVDDYIDDYYPGSFSYKGYFGYLWIEDGDYVFGEFPDYITNQEFVGVGKTISEAEKMFKESVDSHEEWMTSIGWLASFDDSEAG